MATILQTTKPKISASMLSDDVLYSLDWVDKEAARLGWQKCPKGDLMLAVAIERGIDHKLIVLAGCKCAEEGLKYIPNEDLKPLRAIGLAKAWCREEAKKEDVIRAAHAAYDAGNVYDALDNADAANASRGAAAAGFAVGSIYHVVYTTFATSPKRSAEIVREVIPFELIEEKLGETK